MRIWWWRFGGRRGQGPAGSSATDVCEGANGRRSAHSPYSSQYETIVSPGHTRPSTSFGAPALIWHVGVWPRRTMVATGASCDPHDTAGLDHVAAKEEFDKRREAWVKDIDHVIEKLEKKGRLRRDPARGGRPKRFLPPAGASLVDAGARGLTLWWNDPSVPDEQRLDAAIRIRMHVDLAPDYVTYCFYMDIGQLWNSEAIPGERRTRLLQAVDVVGGVCSADIASSPDAPTPPADLSPEDDAALLDARNLLYVRIWEEFTRDMECGLAELSGKRGEVFANFRGFRDAGRHSLAKRGAVFGGRIPGKNRTMTRSSTRTGRKRMLSSRRSGHSSGASLPARTTANSLPAV